ncbi:MAG: hypothetical protein GY943_17625, partial [Chloroflexi bacterium]|nr:hypothetical protein [Chloroflexota bacterium]
MTKRILLIFLTVLMPLLFLFSLPIFSPTLQTVQAQGGDIIVDKQLQNASPVVRVGENLTFTIRIENNSTFTVTTLPLSDTFNTAVLGYIGATPNHDTFDPATGRLDWTDLTTYFGDLTPGQQVTVVVTFVAEHPDTAVVNRAATHDVISSGGSLGNADDSDQVDESIGGSTPLEKLLAAGITPTAGMPLTFTISITNDGAITTTLLPLTENYDPTAIQFNYAVPSPDFVDAMTGVLTWTDLTTWFGDLPAFGTVDVTVVFTALLSTINTVNEASINGAVDWFGNDLTGGADDVPITIIDAPSATATPAPNPTNTPRPAAPAPAATNTPTTTPTTTAVPAAA